MISPTIKDNGKPRYSSGCALLVVILVTLFPDSASGDYESSAVEKYASQNIDGNGNGLCSGVNCAESGSGVSGAMWFGPRLGRRRRSGEKTESFDEDRINAIADALEEAPWTLVSVQGGKRQTNQFTPRLGRESGEDLVRKYILMSENARLTRLMDGQDDMEERQSPPPPPPPFAPRLGRRLPFTPPPRLGRRLRALLQKL